MNPIGRGELFRFGAAAFVADWAFYLVFTSVPLKAIALGGGPMILGLLPALSSTVYIVSALNFGRISDRGGRMRMARAGTVLMALGAVLLRLAPSIPWLFLALPIVGIGGGLFWPTIQAELGDRGGSAGLVRRAGWFNVCWSSGKMLGFWTAGHMAQAYGTAVPLLLAAGLEALVFVAVPREMPRADLREAFCPPAEPNAEIHTESMRRRYRLAAWLANLVAFGVGATLNYQFPKRILSLGLREGDLGNFLAATGLAQTLVFAGLGMRRGWEYRPFWLVGSLLIGLLSAAGLVWASNEVTILLCAPGIGLALGVAYSASLFHSLHERAGRGRSTGIHEALLGSGAFVLPLAGGWLARQTGLTAPYALCAVAFGVAALLAIYWVSPRAAGKIGMAARASGAGPDRS
ncbi:MAG: MFS transporter [Candidatus Eisenbacteria bacterium]|nr:MFS transporter [Candidatus Eisenbacteria bacterium]